MVTAPVQMRLHFFYKKNIDSSQLLSRAPLLSRAGIDISVRDLFRKVTPRGYVHRRNAAPAAPTRGVFQVSEMCAKPLKVSVEVRASGPSDSCGGTCVAAGESLGRPRHRPRVCRARTRRDAGVDDKTPGVCHVPRFACVGGALCRHWLASPSDKLL